MSGCSLPPNGLSCPEGSAYAVGGVFHRLPNSASKKFWAQADPPVTASVRTTMPEQIICLAPHRVPIGRRIDKARIPPNTPADLRAHERKYRCLRAEVRSLRYRRTARARG